jgi:hypothetical protein
MLVNTTLHVRCLDLSSHCYLGNRQSVECSSTIAATLPSIIDGRSMDCLPTTLDHLRVKRNSSTPHSWATYV